MLDPRVHPFIWLGLSEVVLSHLFGKCKHYKMQRIFSTLKIEKVGKCGLIRLDRPRKYNAISIEMFQEIPQGDFVLLK